MKLETRAKRYRAKIPTYKTTTYRICEYLARGNRLTVMDAVRLFNTPNLRSRISELRQYGWPIKARQVNDNGKRFNQYYVR